MQRSLPKRSGRHSTWLFHHSLPEACLKLGGQCCSCGPRRLRLESKIVAIAFYIIRLRKEPSQHSTVSLLTYLQLVVSCCVSLNSFPYYHQARTLLTICLPHLFYLLCFASSFSFLSPNSDFLGSSSILCDNFFLYVFWIGVNNNPSVFQLSDILQIILDISGSLSYCQGC